MVNIKVCKLLISEVYKEASMTTFCLRFIFTRYCGRGNCLEASQEWVYAKIILQLIYIFIFFNASDYNEFVQIIVINSSYIIS
jgi:hypothetical protein